MRFLWFSILVATFFGGPVDSIEIKCECEKCDTTPVKPTCTADIMVLMDSSVCHAGIGWVRIREFAYSQAIQISDRLNLEKSDSRVGVFSFSNRVQQVVPFGNGADLPEQLYDTKTDEGNPLLGDNTNFDVMTDEINDIFRSSQSSHRYVILITNGVGTKEKNNEGRTYYSEREIRQLSNQLKDNQIRVIPVSINDPCAPEHENAPDRNCPKIDLLKIWSFNDGFSNAQLPFSIRNPATSRIISEEILTHLDEDMEQGCGAPPPSRPIEKGPECKLADITILVDGSDSITRDQWGSETLRAVTGWMEGYWDVSAETQITVKQFSDEIRTIYGPANKNDDFYWKNKVESAEQMASSTKLHMAMEDVVSDEFYRERSRKINDLEERFKILIVLSDGWPTDEEFGDLGMQVNNAFDIVVAVGVGDEADLDILRQTIQELRFEPEQSHISNAKSYHELLREIPDIQLEVCRIQQRMALSRKKRIFTPNAELARSKRQLANRGPRPDMLNFSGECDESGFCNCKCTVPITEIEGIAGPRGEPGPRGRDGSPGLPGPMGAPGNTPRGSNDGERGPDGEKGRAGGDGSDGNPGRDGQDGKPGRQGEPGRDGPRGPPGNSDDGRPGERGRNGEPGSDGRSGNPGQDGNPGRDGNDGRDGNPGRAGQDGKPGRPGQDGSPGRPGQSAQAQDGDCGAQGQPGADGEPGFDGRPGSDGEDGKPGSRGAQGDAGRPGKKGPQGNPGPEGDVGDCGKHGGRGEQGPDGYPGEQGDDGIDGLDGMPGQKGPRGSDGQDGPDGEPGLPGIKGAQGNQGRAGMDGNPGDDGEPGEDGQPGDDGPNGADGPRGEVGEPGQKGQPGPDGRPGEADVEALYQQIKAIVRERMGPCKPCENKPKPKPKPCRGRGNNNRGNNDGGNDDGGCPDEEPRPEPSQTFPLNAVFLVDGSDSIRSGKKIDEWNDEWILATRSIQQIVEEMDIRYFSLVQFSDKQIDHIENFDIDARGKQDAKFEIESELEDAQIMKGTNTYHALEHVSAMSFRAIHDSYEDRKDVLFVITDGEPRDDLDKGYVQDVVSDLRDKFDYVFVCVIGEEMRNVDYSNIQGKIQTRPIYLDDYETLPGQLISYFERTSAANDNYLRRIKRSLMSRRSTRERQNDMKKSRRKMSKIDFKKYI